ncbi:MAG: YfcE family phosphodiesterase [Deltaproteobacteria bacterium]|nr:MAG: YfcE family phosphodiesterase [Deltaproteobacteria bacterium]
MLIAVMSDSHDNIWNLRDALAIIKKRNAEMIIHCGDFIAPFMLAELDQGGIPVHGVFGNNDGDKYLLTKLSLTSLTSTTLYDPVGLFEADGFKIGFTHHGIVGEGLAAGGNFNLVCFGHSHKYFFKKIGRTILLNPGEIMGKNGLPSFCLVDTNTAKIEKIELKKTRFMPEEK